MKKLFALAATAFLYTVSIAQPYTTMVDYQKVSRQAVIADMPFPEKTVTKALDDNLGKMGYNGKDSKGFTVYKGVHLAALGEATYDLYFMIDKKSKKEKENSTITMMISSGYDKFITEADDKTLFTNMKAYLTDMRDMVAAYDLELQITDQEATVKSSEKKANDLEEDATDLQKKKKKIEGQIEDNTKAQAAQKTEIEKQHQILETLKGKRKV
jgi:hypothetical protein